MKYNPNQLKHWAQVAMLASSHPTEWAKFVTLVDELRKRLNLSPDQIVGRIKRMAQQ